MHTKTQHTCMHTCKIQKVRGQLTNSHVYVPGESTPFLYSHGGGSTCELQHPTRVNVPCCWMVQHAHAIHTIHTTPSSGGVPGKDHGWGKQRSTNYNIRTIYSSAHTMCVGAWCTIQAWRCHTYQHYKMWTVIMQQHHVPTTHKQLRESTARKRSIPTQSSCRPHKHPWRTAGRSHPCHDTQWLAAIPPLPTTLGSIYSTLQYRSVMRVVVLKLIARKSTRVPGAWRIPNSHQLFPACSNKLWRRWCVFVSGGTGCGGRARGESRRGGHGCTRHECCARGGSQWGEITPARKAVACTPCHKAHVLLCLAV